MSLFRKIKENLSVQIAKRPGRMVLLAILIFNVLFFLLSAFVIQSFSLSGTEKMGFFEAAFCTITMILDAGCIQFVVSDIGQASVTVALVCIVIIILGMISFTGAIIGYLSNYISNFVDSANSGTRKLHISDHMVVINWNTRASEIINDLLYCKNSKKVVVLVAGGKKEIEKEIAERLSDTISRENTLLRKQIQNRSLLDRIALYHKGKLVNNIMVIVREGDVFSSKQLHDICIERAKTVIILGNDINNTICKYEHKDKIDERLNGNAQTIKTLMQVSDITGSDYSFDDQQIIVEISDEWTEELVDQIISYKQVDGKCNIIPLQVNRVLGQILSQISLMPELNLAYKELFSNKGVTFFSRKESTDDEIKSISEYLDKHFHALPLTYMQNHSGSYAYYACSTEKDIYKESAAKKSDYKISYNRDYWIEKKNVIILGHNSKCKDIMRGFEAFRCEWNYKNSEEEILDIMVIDDTKSLEKLDYYKDYPFVLKTVDASIYDKELICDTINEYISEHDGDISILILSDDMVINENVDSNALACLVYVQDIINNRKKTDISLNTKNIDVIVEIIDPKHNDVVNSYSIKNVVISNRYISKMITQLGEKEELYNFYADFLTYDTEEGEYESKEIYLKKVGKLFNEIPADCTAAEFVRAVFEASVSDDLEKSEKNPSIVLGYVKADGKMVLFERNQNNIKLHFEAEDKLIIFSNH